MDEDTLARLIEEAEISGELALINRGTCILTVCLYHDLNTVSP
jgi:hypothetical protein